MTVWAMAPAEHTSEHYQNCWKYDLTHGVISMGWDLGEAPESKQHLVWLWENYDKPDLPGWYTDHGLKMLERFWFDVRHGDMVVARGGVLKYVGIGEFTGMPFYDEDAYGLTWGCNFRRVVWMPGAQERYSPIRFGRHTLYALKPWQSARFGL